VGRQVLVGSPTNQLVQSAGLRLFVDRREHLGVVGEGTYDPGPADPGLVRRETVLRLQHAAVPAGAVWTLHYGQSVEQLRCERVSE